MCSASSSVRFCFLFVFVCVWPALFSVSFGDSRKHFPGAIFVGVRLPATLALSLLSLSLSLSSPRFSPLAFSLFSCSSLSLFVSPFVVVVLPSPPLFSLRPSLLVVSPSFLPSPLLVFFSPRSIFLVSDWLNV
jgi:hypothetical protein